MAAAILLMNYLFIPRALGDVKETLVFAGPIVNSCLRDFPYYFNISFFYAFIFFTLFFILYNRQGSLFLFMASHFARKTGKVEHAIPYLERAIAHCKENNLQPNNFIFEYGCCYFMKLEWENALNVFQQLVNDETNEFEMKGFCAMQLALVYYYSYSNSFFCSNFFLSFFFFPFTLPIAPVM